MDALQKRSLGLRVAVIAAILIWLASTRFGQPSPSEEAAGPVGTQPRIEVLAPYKGKVVLANLFATWCGPCLAEIPDLIKLQAAHPNDLAIVGLQVMDLNGEPLPDFKKRLGINYPLIDANDNLEVEKAFGAPDFLPVSVILDRTGKIVATLTGRTRLEEFERRLALYF
ncbi:MAG: TlpA family protein disulfide reductase [Acidobacteria bacterium]|nr:MAG: TlpA family protein disulfide reductase [Acidobacteriota bacterium]